ncbi:unnamed protein product [Heligmosomoides polygyrus]|uniref:ShKT domain-containing protein n=1 Tax=Heligmosomoides polygyrus TaxID=6339 RepID=A0A183F9M5_HELPZ|nr:unnamed protein product [Heligmosomoides polygyrus]
MNLWCKASCGICRPTTYNLNVGVDRFASAHKTYRNHKIRLLGGPGMQPTTAPPVSSTCLNQHYCCIAWASRGYCSSNAAYMRQYCQPSCNFCRGPSSSSEFGAQRGQMQPVTCVRAALLAVPPLEVSLTINCLATDLPR